METIALALHVNGEAKMVSILLGSPASGDHLSIARVGAEADKVSILLGSPASGDFLNKIIYLTYIILFPFF